VKFKVYLVAALTMLSAGVGATGSWAGDPSGTCAVGYYCISRTAIANNATTTMSQGWRQGELGAYLWYDGSGSFANLLTNDVYSGGGACVGCLGDQRSIRNRASQGKLLMCMMNYLGNGLWSITKTANYSTQYWVQMPIPNDANSFRAGVSQTACI
jgi:hypothetical protein